MQQRLTAAITRCVSTAAATAAWHLVHRKAPQRLVSCPTEAAPVPWQPCVLYISWLGSEKAGLATGALPVSCGGGDLLPPAQNSLTLNPMMDT